MAFVATATAVGGWALGTGVAAGIGSTIVGGALIGAGIGGAYSALTGDGNILNSMLTGGLIGGAGAGGLSAAGVGAAPVAGPAGGATGLGAVGPAATTVSTPIAAGTVAAPGAAPLALTGTGAAPLVSGAGTVTSGVAPTVAGSSGMKALGYGLAGTTALSLLGNKQGGAGAGPMPDPGTIRPFAYSSTPNEATGIYPSPYATASYDASGNPIMDTREINYFNQNFAALKPYSAKTGTVNPNIPLPSSSLVNAAGGGIMRGYDDELGGDYSAMGMDQGNLQKGLFNMGYASGGSVKKYGFGGLTLIEDMISQAEQGQQAQIPKYNFDQGTQRYSVADQPMIGTPSFGGYSFDPNTDRYSTNPQPMAAGGMTSLGDYSDGGRLLKGPGDGVSDSIPATIADKQPARLADGEFVIPARIVSEIGNGSTDAGAKRLYAMMDRIQAGRKKTIGKKNVAKDTKAKKHLLT